MRFDCTSCYCCPSHFTYGDVIPQKRNGVMMHLGEHFCLHRKRAIRLKARDLKKRVPDCCPKRISPPLLKLYDFKDEPSRRMQLLFGSGYPSEFRYALRREGTLPMAIKDFWQACESGEDAGELLGMTLMEGQVLELDDGLNHVFLYNGANGLAKCRFNPEAVKE